MSASPLESEPCLAERVMSWIETIERTRGLKAKQELIREIVSVSDAESIETLKMTFRYAYDQGIRFGIAADRIEPPVTLPRGERRPFNISVFGELDRVIAESGRTRKLERIDRLLTGMDQDGRDLISRIIGKDLRCGVNESTLNKVFPDLLSKFSVMLAKQFSARHVDAWPVAVEPKMDGLRCIAEVDVGSEDVMFFTRTGKAITSLDNFKPELLALAKRFTHNFEGTEVTPTVAFDSEVTSGEFLESMSSVRKATEQVEEGTLHIFDALTRSSGHSPIALSDEELAKQGDYVERRDRLMRAWLSFLTERGEEKPKFLTMTPSYLARSEDEITALYANARDQGFEGLIIKNRTSPYVKKRSSDWMKIKAEETLDLPIVGAFEGTGKFEGMLGGLIVMNGDTKVRVGSGFSDDQRSEFWEQFLADMEHIKADNRDRCRLVDVPAEIQFQEQLPSGSLRHPVFARLRHDKRSEVGAF